MSQRYHGLDALRAGAMLLGLVLHACQLYLTPELMADVYPQASTPPPPISDALGVLVIWIHNWRMPLFFLLAGFFAEMTLEKRGRAAFWRDRAIRVFGALCVFHGLFMLLFARRLGEIDHLWFLWLLSLMCLIAPFIPAAKTIGWVHRPRQLCWLLIPATFAGLIGRQGLWHIYPQGLFDFAWQSFALYLTFFIVGQGLWHNRSVLAALANAVCAFAMMLGGCVVLAALVLLDAMDVPHAWLQPVVAAGTLLWSFGLIALMQWLVTSGAAWLNTLVTVSYPVYVLHLYPVMLFSALAIDANFPQGLTVIFATFGGFLASVLAYAVFIRSTPLNWVLAGWHKSRFQWPFAQTGKPTKKAAP